MADPSRQVAIVTGAGTGIGKSAALLRQELNHKIKITPGGIEVVPRRRTKDIKRLDVMSFAEPFQLIKIA